MKRVTVKETRAVLVGMEATGGSRGWSGGYKEGEEELPPGWEWIWLEDLWAGKVEKLWIPKEEPDARRRRENGPIPSY